MTGPLGATPPLAAHPAADTHQGLSEHGGSLIGLSHSPVSEPPSGPNDARVLCGSPPPGREARSLWMEALFLRLGSHGRLLSARFGPAHPTCPQTRTNGGRGPWWEVARAPLNPEAVSNSSFPVDRDGICFLEAGKIELPMFVQN